MPGFLPRSAGPLRAPTPDPAVIGEPMEAPGGQQEPAAGAGSGPSGSEEIDLSLDDIIKRNKKGHIKAVGNRWRQRLKNRNPPYSNGRPRFRSWAPQSVPGPYRFRGGSRKQQYYRKQFWNGMTGPRRRMATQPKNGTSPLNRPASAEQQGKQDEPMLEGNSDGVAANTQQGQPTRAKWIRRPNAFPSTQRPFQLNRRPAFMQRQSRFHFSRGQKESSSNGKQPRVRRWQIQPSSGAVLTISVSNLQANQMKMPGAKRPFLKGRSTPTKMTHPKPKGVSLRFNFRAMANQTSLTLNERFSGLRHKHRFTPLRSMSRMVTLP